jgi:hypothetical protein
MELDDPHRRHEIEIELRALESRLSTWRPANGALDRDRMLYDAGRSVARVQSYVQAWRIATAAFLFLCVASGALLARQRIVLAHAQDLLALERAQRLIVETRLAAQTQAAPTDASRSPEPEPAEPFAPNSYFVLASRQAMEIAGSSSPGVNMPEVNGRRERQRSNKPSRATPLRPRDYERILEL